MGSGLGNDTDQYDQIFAALKHPIRRQILMMLEEKGEASFTEIQNTTCLEDTGLLSYHLKELAPMINQSERGKYRLSNVGLASMALFHRVERDEQNAYETFRVNVGMFIKEVFVLSAVACITLLPLVVFGVWFKAPYYAYTGELGRSVGWILISSELTCLGMLFGAIGFVLYDRHYYSKKVKTNVLHTLFFALGIGCLVFIYFVLTHALWIFEIAYAPLSENTLFNSTLFQLTFMILIAFIAVAPMAAYALSRFLNGRIVGKNSRGETKSVAASG